MTLNRKTKAGNPRSLSGSITNVSHQDMPRSDERPQAAWILGFSLASVVLSIATSWAVIIQVVLLGVAIYQLTRRPEKRDRNLLLLSCGVIAISLAWIIATTLVIYGFSSDVEITSVPLPT